MAKNIHIPVLLEECLQNLAPALDQPKSVLVDGTLGGAGHARAFLEKFPQLNVLGCDLDANAIQAAHGSLETFLKQHRVTFFHGSFAELGANNAPIALPWDAILLDLGYSSNQLEDARYGMSLQVDGPIDMRLTRTETHESKIPSAWDLLQGCSPKELADIFDAYGEIHGSRKLAYKIKDAIATGELKDSTKSLARLIENVSPPSKEIHPATLAFQALRIAVNDELRALDTFLKHAMLNLRKGGRLAVITFHSLEDRIVKHWGTKEAAAQMITKKPVTATETEIQKNPRARSAKLRVYEKT